MEQDRRVILYGAGGAGRLIYEMLKICSIDVFCFVDNKTEMNGTTIIDKKKCVIPSAIENKEQYEVCICVSNEKYEPVDNNGGWQYNVIRLGESGESEKFFIRNDQISLVETHARKDGFTRFFDLSMVIDNVILKTPNILLRVLKLIYNSNYVDVFLPRMRKRCGNLMIDKTQGTKCTEKVAVYTGIFGDYDELLQPDIHPENIDYFFVSDEKPNDCGVFTWVDAKIVIPAYISNPIMRNRYIKMHPHIIFPEYTRTIYVDGTLKIKKDISDFIHKNKTGFSAFEHYERDCLFYEALQIVNAKRVVPEDVYNQMKRYIEDGMPLHYGLTEMPVVACNHTISMCDILLEEWWKEFNRGARRDQFSFMYILWKNGFSISDVSSLGDNFRNSERFEYHLHSRFSKHEKNQ